MGRRYRASACRTDTSGTRPKTWSSTPRGADSRRGSSAIGGTGVRRRPRAAVDDGPRLVLQRGGIRVVAPYVVRLPPVQIRSRVRAGPRVDADDLTRAEDEPREDEPIDGAGARHIVKDPLREGDLRTPEVADHDVLVVPTGVGVGIGAARIRVVVGGGDPNLRRGKGGRRG